jgi:hypothetical protein
MAGFAAKNFLGWGNLSKPDLIAILNKYKREGHLTDYDDWISSVEIYNAGFFRGSVAERAVETINKYLIDAVLIAQNDFGMSQKGIATNEVYGDEWLNIYFITPSSGDPDRLLERLRATGGAELVL